MSDTSWFVDMPFKGDEEVANIRLCLRLKVKVTGRRSETEVHSRRVCVILFIKFFLFVALKASVRSYSS